MTRKQSEASAEAPQVAADEVKATTLQLIPLKQALQAGDAKQAKACLGQLRALGGESKKVVGIGAFTAFKPSFLGLTKKDFEGLSLHDACLMNPTVPSKLFEKFLCDQGAILGGKITVGASAGHARVASTVPDPRGR